jgi:low affinity Fe/Cu permease
MKVQHAKSRFTRIAEATARTTGKPITFAAAVAVIVIWAAVGPLFGFSDTWQLVVNTGTTIVTFLMVFLIQNTQNRDSQAVQVKLDELIRSHRGAHNTLLDLEEMEVEDLDKLRDEYEALAKEAREKADKAGQAHHKKKKLRQEAKELKEEANEIKEEADEKKKAQKRKA